ncbi:MAG: phenylalanine--tRNA ligase subunit alpha [Bradymonadales bacterium]|nr:MAG: phenylalanine--tRNA ligase subunit alpha [Bradymonadales bacterium]
MELLDEATKESAAVKSLHELRELKSRFLGKKGELSRLLASLKDLQPEAKKDFGAKLNETRRALENLFQVAESRLESEALEKQLRESDLDASAPGVFFPPAQPHPIREVMEEAISILERAGLQAIYGPEVEFEDYCFDRLNFQKDHAARDMQATFFVKSAGDRSLILRTHTSPVQVRALLKLAKAEKRLPIRIQAPGRVYRVDDDATHAPMFHQIEGLVVDTQSGMPELRATLDYFFRKFFGEKTKIRFRPSYFPFTEPSAEVDASCVFCQGLGCKVCKQSGWLELAGAGLVHPNVFQACGWNPEEVQGWAFGMGIERLAMLKLKIPDLRSFFENRLSFLRGRVR